MKRYKKLETTGVEASTAEIALAIVFALSLLFVGGGQPWLWVFPTAFFVALFYKLLRHGGSGPTDAPHGAAG